MIESTQVDLAEHANKNALSVSPYLGPSPHSLGVEKGRYYLVFKDRRDTAWQTGFNRLLPAGCQGF